MKILFYNKISCDCKRFNNSATIYLRSHHQFISTLHIRRTYLLRVNIVLLLICLSMGLKICFTAKFLEEKSLSPFTKLHPSTWVILTLMISHLHFVRMPSICLQNEPDTRSAYANLKRHKSSNFSRIRSTYSI